MKGCAELTAVLLHHAPRLTILATSREILGVEGEFPFRVPPLKMPEPSCLPPLDKLNLFDALRLFTERAGVVSPGFALTEDNAATVAQITQQLDGIPLAIELAAARIRQLSPDQIAARLEDTFHILTRGSRTVLPRQQTLRASIDWSYQLLSLAERTLLMRLSVFSGGWTLEAAEKVCCDISAEGKLEALRREDILDFLAQMVDKSLVIVSSGDRETRYHFLETIRQYAKEKLIDANGEVAIREKHLVYYMNFAEQAEPHFRGKKQLIWLDRVEADLGNIRIALDWSLNGQIEEGMRLVSALMWLWHIRGPEKEGADWGERLLKADQLILDNPDQTVGLSTAHRLIRGKTLLAAGFTSCFVNRLARSNSLLEESMIVWDGLGIQGERGLAMTQLYLGYVKPELNDQFDLLSKSLAYFKKVGDNFNRAEADLYMGMFFLNKKNDLGQARYYIEECLTLWKVFGDIDRIATGFLTLGNLATAEGNYPEAGKMYSEALSRYQITGDKSLIQLIYIRRGILAMYQDNWEEAATNFKEIMTMGWESGDSDQIINGLNFLAWLALNKGDFQTARHMNLEMIAFSIDRNNLISVAWGKANMVTLYLLEGNDAQGLALIIEAINILNSLNAVEQDPGLSYSILRDIAMRLADRRQFRSALLLFSHLIQQPIWSSLYYSNKEKARYDQCLAAAKIALGEDEQIVIEDGNKLSQEEALELAIQELGTQLAPHNEDEEVFSIVRKENLGLCVGK